MNTEDQIQSREILDVKGAAQILGCSPSHVSNILNGRIAGVPPIPHIRAGRLLDGREHIELPEVARG